MTPKEFFICVDGFNRRKEIEAEDFKLKFELEKKVLIHQAYLISRWVWSKDVDIKKALDFKAESKVMTDEQMLEKVKILNKIFGGEVQ